MDNDAFTIRRVGTAGHEIREPNGNIVGWAIDGTWAVHDRRPAEPGRSGGAGVPRQLGTHPGTEEEGMSGIIQFNWQTKVFPNQLEMVIADLLCWWQRR